jgi:hypothetical protein
MKPNSPHMSAFFYKFYISHIKITFPLVLRPFFCLTKAMFSLTSLLLNERTKEEGENMKQSPLLLSFSRPAICIAT